MNGYTFKFFCLFLYVTELYLHIKGSDKSYLPVGYIQVQRSCKCTYTSIRCFCSILCFGEACMLHNFSIRGKLFAVTPCTSVHVHSKLQSMIATCNICFVISILQLKVRNGRGRRWRKTLLILLLSALTLKAPNKKM